MMEFITAAFASLGVGMVVASAWLVGRRIVVGRWPGHRSAWPTAVTVIAIPLWIALSLYLAW